MSRFSIFMVTVCLSVAITGCPKSEPLTPIKDSGQSALRATSSPNGEFRPNIVKIEPVQKRGVYYVVKKDDTLFTIAKAHGVNWRLIYDVNDLATKRFVVGIKLFIPTKDGAKIITPATPAPKARSVAPVNDTELDQKKPALTRLFSRQPKGQYHTVKTGETLKIIADAYGVRPEDIAAANNIKISDQLTNGMRLFVPRASRTGMTAERPEPDLRRSTLPEQIEGPVSKYGYSWPGKGEVIASFGDNFNGKRCKGIAIGSQRGAPATATAAGKVILSTDNFPGYGKTIMIDHGNGIVSMYAHLETRMAPRGKSVMRGTVIGTIGQSGRAASPTLFFAVIRDFEFINPLPYMP